MRIYTVRVFFCSIILVNENKWLPLLNKNACIRKNIQCHMEIKRDLYLNKLIRSMHNGMIKVVTGIRRCGKSYLLFNLFGDYLKAQGVDDEHIITFAAVGLHEARLADGLARAGQVFDAGNHVDVGTAYYQNLVHVRLSLVNFCRFFALRGPDAAQSRGNAVFRFSGRPPIVPDAVSCRFAPVVFIGCLCRIRFLWGLWQMFGFRMLSFQLCLRLSFAQI